MESTVTRWVSQQIHVFVMVITWRKVGALGPWDWHCSHFPTLLHLGPVFIICLEMTWCWCLRIDNPPGSSGSRNIKTSPCECFMQDFQPDSFFRVLESRFMKKTIANMILQSYMMVLFFSEVEYPMLTTQYLFYSITYHKRSTIHVWKYTIHGSYGNWMGGSQRSPINRYVTGDHPETSLPKMVVPLGWYIPWLFNPPRNPLKLI